MSGWPAGIRLTGRSKRPHADKGWLAGLIVAAVEVAVFAAAIGIAVAVLVHRRVVCRQFLIFSFVLTRSDPVDFDRAGRRKSVAQVATLQSAKAPKPFGFGRHPSPPMGRS
jgi:hypothetical protein